MGKEGMKLGVVSAPSDWRSKMWWRRYKCASYLALISILLLVLLTHHCDGHPQSRDFEIDGLDICDELEMRYEIFCLCRESLTCYFTKDHNASSSFWTSVASSTHTSVVIRSRPPERLKTLPEPTVFGSMTKLIDVHLQYNSFASAPPFVFGNSSSIRSVKITNNGIQHLEKYAFSNLPHLEELDLGFNNLTEIERDVFVNLPSLKELYLEQNNIQTIRDNAFIHLKSLKTLELQNNKLTTIVTEVFAGLDKLQRIDLRSNQIEYLGDFVFSKLKNLVGLDLNDNKIKLLSPTAFRGLARLRRLSLGNNQILEIEGGLFKDLVQTHYLDLRNNALRAITWESIQPIYPGLLNESMMFLLEGNRFVCNCQIVWMLKLYNESESRYLKRSLEKVKCDISTGNDAFNSEGNATAETVPLISYESEGTVAEGEVEKNLKQGLDLANCNYDFRDWSTDESDEEEQYNVQDSKAISSVETSVVAKDVGSTSAKMNPLKPFGLVVIAVLRRLVILS